MNKICRICLEEGVLSSIFTKNFNLTLCEMIEYCSNTKISKNDGLPEQMCSNCVYKLGIAYHFKQTCEGADLRLRQYLGLHTPQKFHDAAVMTDPMIPVRTTIIKKCKCMSQRKSSGNYKRKPESEKQKRGPKPKPKREHACYQCDKQFRCQAQLEMHVRTHTGDKPFGCMYCPRRFTQKHNLTIHLRVHTGEKPFQCEVCSKRFSAQGNLQAHLKIHTGQKDHVCSLCSKSFITSSELSRHASSHVATRSFSCALCGANYVQRRDLKLHKQKKHQVTEESAKTQSEAYNNANIDIIGIDVGKDVAPNPPPPIKDVNHHIQHLIDPKPHDNPPDQTHILTFDQRTLKDIYPSHGYTKNVDSHNCAICGEGFEYLTALAQHHLQYHKGYEPLHIKNYSAL